MAAEYDFRKKPAPAGSSDSELLYPRIVSKGTIDSEKIVRNISEASSFTPGDIEGLLVALEGQISHYLSEGYHVELGRLGYFSAGLKARPVSNPKEIRAGSIYFGSVNFRASAWLKKQSRGWVVRSTRKFRSSDNLPEEVRRRRMEKFLDTNPFMTRKDYSYLTGLLKNKALEDLNRFVEENILDTMGSGSHKVYVRPKKVQDTSEKTQEMSEKA